ncbi:MAG: ArnT family glycosyltransferase [Pyrinomonadaceae bacterium]
MTPEITTTDIEDRSALPSWLWICLALLAVFTYFFGLTIPLLGPDEPRYAQVAREMFERGDWVTPTLGGYNWFEKPALLYWLEIASFTLLGVSEAAARVGPALFGLGTVASLWLLGRSVVTAEGHGTNTNFANWLALVAASTLGIMVFSRGASFDITVTFPLTAALVAFFVFDQKHRTSRTGEYFPLVCFYFFIGLALLAKGLIGIVFPYAIVAFYFVLSRRMPSRKFILSLLWGTLLAAAIAGLWYLPMYLRHGWEFVDEFFLQHHFQRFTSNKYKHPQPFYFFFWVLPLMTLPWLPLFIAAIWNLIKGIIQHKATEITEKDENRYLHFTTSPLLLLSIAWLGVPLVFFSLSGSKLPGYILPAVPPAIIISALFITRLVHKPVWKIIVTGIATATFVVTVVLLTTVVPGFADHDSVRSLIAAADERGLASSKVLTLHTISHNAEFYAAGRLLRDEKGRQRKLYGPTEIVNVLAAEGGKAVLVLVPLEYQHQLTGAPQLRTEFLKDNGEFAIFAVFAK